MERDVLFALTAHRSPVFWHLFSVAEHKSSEKATVRFLLLLRLFSTCSRAKSRLLSAATRSPSAHSSIGSPATAHLLSSGHGSSSNPHFLHHSFLHRLLIWPQPPPPLSRRCVQREEVYSFIKWGEAGARIEEEVEGGLLGRDPFSKRYLFICFPSTFHCYLEGGRKRWKETRKTHWRTLRNGPDGHHS